MDLNNYIIIIVTAICFCIGYILKNIIPSDKINKYIPLIMGVLGTLINVWFNHWAFTPEILLQGLVSGLASTGTFEAVTNLTTKK